MGIFGGIASAKAMNSGSYVRPGHYLARIDNVKLAKNRKNGDYVAIEMTCLHAFPDGEKPADGSAGHRPGEAMSDVITSGNDLFLPKVKGFISKVMHVNENEVGENDAELVTGPTQPLKGCVVEVIGRTIVTKVNRKQITQVSYVGQVRAEKLPEILAPEVLESQFRDDALEQLAAHQAELLGS